MSTIGEHLLRLLENRINEQLRFLETLTEEERLATGGADAWSPKDTVAHVVETDKMMAVWLLEPQGQETDEEEDFNKTNERNRLKYLDISWEEISDLSREHFEMLVGAVQGMTEEELIDPENLLTPGRSIWRTVNFVGYYHAKQHLAELYNRRGDRTYGNKLQEDAAEKQLILSDEDDWRGAVIYNLGCYYKVTGQCEKALEKVRQGLALNPGLKELAAEDTDLKSIRDDPEFKSIVG